MYSGSAQPSTLPFLTRSMNLLISQVNFKKSRHVVG